MDDRTDTQTRRPGSGWPFPSQRHAVTLVLLSAVSSLAAAGIQTDGSAGAAQTLTGPNYMIPQALGTVAGNNLFHSFHTFGIGSGESATFQTAVTGNVVSRVTGGSSSQINGALNLVASGGATPAFWFINPAGIVFGSGSSINVPGAFHAGTADYIGFADGSRFHANLTQTSSFSTAPPESFGFLGGNRATISIRDGAVLNNQDQQLTLIAGDVLVDGAEVRTRSGDIRIVALGDQTGEVDTSGPLPLAEGSLNLFNDSVVQTMADTAAPGGNVAVAAGEAYVDFSTLRARTIGAGDSGSLLIEAASLTATNNSRIGSRSDASGNGGSVTILVRGDLQVDGASLVSSNTQGSGRAGDVFVQADGTVTVLGDGSWISSDTFADGDAGSVTVSANSLHIDAHGGAAGISSEAVGTGGWGNAGQIDVSVTGQTTLLDGGRVSSRTEGIGNAGWVSLSTGSLLIDGLFAGSEPTGVLSTAENGAWGDAGAVWVSVSGSPGLINGGIISSSSKGFGAPGWVDVTADNLQISGSNYNGVYSAIVSDAGSFSEGLFSGFVAATTAGDLEVSDGGRISTNSEGVLDAGYIDVRAGRAIHLSNSSFIASDSSGGGRAGNVQVSAAALQMTDNTYISSDALGNGDAGSVSVTVDGAATLTDSMISSDSYGVGWGGNVSLIAASLTLDNATVTSDAAGSGNAGNVDVQVSGLTTLLRNAWISSDTYDIGNAGAVSVRTGSLLIDGEGSATGISSEALTGSSGHAGLVTTEVNGTAELRAGGQISSSTYATGNAGVVYVSADNLNIDGSGSFGDPTGVITTAASGAGHAGYVIVESPGAVSVTNGGQISSSTASATGAAGVVLVVAREVRVDGIGSAIAARAEAGSSGQTGFVAVVPSSVYEITAQPINTERITVTNGGEITIANHATVADPSLVTRGYIDLQANNINITNASVTASSTGNLPASDILITFSDRLFVDPSRISTSSNEGDGGDITIRGGQVLWLDRSQITTSVASPTNGNGGNIDISADYLVMNNAFIQANTNAPANGGDIAIDVNALIPSYNSLLVGGAVPLVFDASTPGYNVIQAAAPDGISGNIQITSPELDLAGSLADLKAQSLQGGGLGRSPCDTTAGSSLATVGRGGLPPSARDALRIETETAASPSAARQDIPPQLAQQITLECQI